MITKYFELQDKLSELIDSGICTTTDGAFLSEREISEMFNVSRTTVRHAIAELCKQGQLVQIHGKGTFVKNKLRTHSIFSITHCSQNYFELGLSPFRTVLESKVLPATPNVAAKLQIASEDSVLFLRILYSANRTIFNETLSYIPVKRFANVERIDFSVAPLLEILKEKYAAIPVQTDTSIEAVLPSTQLSQDLEIDTETPVILFEAVTSGQYNQMMVPFEYFKTYYRTDFMRFNFVQYHNI